MNHLNILAVATVAFLAAAAPLRAGSQHGGHSVTKRVEVAASPSRVWQAWTTEEGARTFFAPAVNIEATLGGHYEIFFSPERPYGFRGADGNKVHDMIEGELLVFTWNAPTDFGVLRNLHTLVFVRLEELGPNRTRVSLNHVGFGESAPWLKLRDYFDSAWGVVLSRLQHRFEHGPVDWENPPAVGAAESEGVRSEGAGR